jgi:hypothetical protein
MEYNKGKANILSHESRDRQRIIEGIMKREGEKRNEEELRI